MSAINSILRVYQGSSAVSAFAMSTVSPSSLPLDECLSQTGDGDGIAPYEPIENLPTASRIDEQGDGLSSKSVPNNLFFHSPLKWFMKQPHGEGYFTDDSAPEEANANDTEGEHKQRGDEPSEEHKEYEDKAYEDKQYEDKENVVDGAVILVDGEMDPIYETYVRYVYYTHGFNDEEQRQEEDMGDTPRATPITYETGQTVTPEEYKKSSPQGANYSSMGSLRRLRTKTKQFLRQITTYENHGETGNRSHSFRKSLGMSKWIHGKDDDCLFSNPEFQKRLQEGSVASRRQSCEPVTGNDENAEAVNHHHHETHRTFHYWKEKLVKRVHSFLSLKEGVV